jgi:hypothetical protein
MVIRRVNVVSAAKVGGVLQASIGLLIGLCFAVVSVLAGIAGAAADQDVPWLTPFLGVGGILFFPLLYGIIGLVMGALIAAVYNLVAGLIGGLEIDVA